MQPWMIRELERQRRLETEQRMKRQQRRRSRTAELPAAMWLQPNNMPAANEMPTKNYEREVLVADV
jgi:hypothetical protein